MGVWAMLTLIGGDRARRMREVRARLRAEAQADQNPPDQVISVS